MLTKIQIRANGPTAHEVEGELRWAAARLIADFGLTGDLSEQVIEGTPDKSFGGRLSIVVTGQPTETHSAVTFRPLSDSAIKVVNVDVKGVTRSANKSQKARP